MPYPESETEENDPETSEDGRLSRPCGFALLVEVNWKI